MIEQLKFVVDSTASVLTLEFMAFMFFGTFVGILVGALPGLSAITALAVLMPFTYVMDYRVAIAFFLAIYVGTQFGNSIPAILLYLPGTPSALITAIEGHGLEKTGRGDEALGASLTSSVFGQLLGGIGVALLLVPFAAVAVYFLMPEIFALSILGIAATAGLAGKSPAKGLLSGCLGVALTTIGPDPVTGRPRFDFGNMNLAQGLDTVAVTIGLLIIGHILYQWIYEEADCGYEPKAKKAKRNIVLTWKAFVYTLRVNILGSVVGFFIGALPGAGGSIAGVIAYQQSKMVAHDPELYGGKGSVEAVAASDAAQNGATAGSVIPTMGLGIPGSPAMLMVLAVLIIHGITPGPALMRSNPESLMVTIGALVVAPLILLVSGYLAVKPSLYLVTHVSPQLLRIGALILSITGVYALRSSMYDVWVALALGFVGFLMYVYKYPVLPAAIGALLGGVIESNMRRGFIMTHGSPLEFFTRIPVVCILLLCVVTLIWAPALKWIRGKWSASSKKQSV